MKSFKELKIHHKINSNKEVKTKASTNEKQNFTNEAAQVATIVDKSIKQKNFSKMGKELENLPSTEIERTQYVFKAPHIFAFVVVLILSLIFLIIFVYFAFLGLGMHLYSNNYDIYSALFLSISILAIIVDGVLIIKSCSMITYIRRYQKYYEIMKFKKVNLVDDICNYSSINFDIVVKDLTKAVKLKIIPQGHFTTENLAFIVSDVMYEKYQSNRVQYDHYYRKLIEERARMNERSEEIQKILDMGEKYVKKIDESNQLIKDKNISNKLEKLEIIVSTIFREVDIHPEQAEKLGMFLNYYLPTMDKLLNTYIDIDEKRIEGTNIKQAKKDIDHAIDLLIESFEGILNEFYEKQEMDIATDVSTMETMMNQDNL